jgi:hypothetical protein
VRRNWEKGLHNPSAANDEGRTMGLILLVLLLAIILGAVGFWQAINILWIIALVLLAVWLIGFLVRGAEGARWYRW